MSGFKLGDEVTWISSNTRKNGVIIGVIPAGESPANLGFTKAGGGGIPRTMETYVIRGWKLNYSGKQYGGKADYWPHVSLLEHL